MIVNFLHLSFFALALAQGSGDHFETLKLSAEKTSEKVLETQQDVNKSSSLYDEYIKERSECLLWEYTTQKSNFNKSITAAVTKGILKNKPIKSFFCVSNASRDTFDKLDKTHSEISVEIHKIKNKRLDDVTPLRFILSPIHGFVQDFYKAKEGEMKKTSDEAGRKKILDEFLKTMAGLDTILNEIGGHVTSSKFKFFEEFGKYAHLTESKFRSLQREGSQKLSKCVS